ncbi:hypothetical protein TRAPUB_10916 [Trametes pubescens]|uniref:Uncharacterized protein n=1 Tax=Trametes pubescens TaxID=154538 RepID=A0A1M2VY49_TRAPU|nr:hypothetical protein TRAPUB_10916 [Trametes pubescens]
MSQSARLPAATRYVSSWDQRRLQVFATLAIVGQVEFCGPWALILRWVCVSTCV